MTDTSHDDTDARLQTLELKLMDMEVTLEKLNESLIRLYHDNQASRDMLHRLQDKVATLTSADDVSTDPLHEKPPHY